MFKLSFSLIIRQNSDFFPWRFLRIEIGLLMQSLNFSMCCSISWYKNFDLILWEYDSRILHRNLKLRRQHLYSWLFSWKYALLLMHTVYVYLIWVNFRNLRTRLKSIFLSVFGIKSFSRSFPSDQTWIVRWRISWGIKW